MDGGHRWRADSAHGLGFPGGPTRPARAAGGVRLLGRIGHAGVRPVLERIAGDEQEEEIVRSAATTALTMLGG